ncbi:MAG TPA: ATP-binding protein, partial [Verrucomicrobiae bacterium]|nr:ATP-binding protein [Verrucomicrobiae bacterium]
NGMIPKSIKWRLQLWYGLLLVAVLSGFGFTAYRWQRTETLSQVDQSLLLRVNAGMTGLKPPGPLDRRRPPPDGPFDGGGPERRPPLDDDPGPFRPPERDGPEGEEFRPPPPLHGFRLPPEQARNFQEDDPNDFYFVIWSRYGAEIGRSRNAPADLEMPQRPTNKELRHKLRTHGGFREMYHFTPLGECVLAGHLMKREEAKLGELARLLVGSGVAVLLMGLAGGWWLVNSALRPVSAISATAAKIAGGDLSQRIDGGDTDSELGQLAGVLNSTFSRLDAAFTQQARFTSDAAHELRTPVAVMLTQTQSALHRERTAPEYRETLEACQRAAQRMRRLIESLLELARLDAGQEQPRRRRFDLTKTALECVDLLRPLAAERRVQLECDTAPVECSGDPDRLAQVITNLVANAIHHNEPNGDVRVTTRKENGVVICAVADKGQGIAPEHLEHIFERFYRADLARTSAVGRTGLGLAITQAIVRAHGGTVEVASEVGKGTTFTVRFPDVGEGGAARTENRHEPA